MDSAYKPIGNAEHASSGFIDMMGGHPEIFQDLMDTIPCGMCLIDPRGRIFQWNAAAERLTGIPRANAIGHTCREVFNCPEIERSCTLMHPGGGSTGPFSFNVVLNHQGRRVHLQKTANYLHDTQGRLICSIESLVDLTRQDDTEAALQEARELVESARNAKRHFMANMTHEIRTPLNGIMGLLDLMLTEAPPPAQLEYLTTAKHSADLLMDVIDDILDFTIVDKGIANIEVTGFSLTSIISAIIARQYAMTQNKQVCIHSRVEEDVPDNLLGDSGRLYQILKHTIGNAIKFTPAGEVAVRVARVPSTGKASHEAARRIMLHFSISDTGVGIPKKKLDSIFQSLSQVDGSLTRPFSGLGIGLNLVHQLVGLLEGRTWMESEENRGTTVHFILPFKTASTSDMDPTMGRPVAASSRPTATIVVSSRGTTAVDTYMGPEDRNLSLAASPLPPEWFARFEALSDLFRHDSDGAEALLEELKRESQKAHQGSLSTLLFRLVLALRRADQEAIHHYYTIIDQKIKSDPGVCNTAKGGTHEGTHR